MKQITITVEAAQQIEEALEFAIRFVDVDHNRRWIGGEKCLAAIRAARAQAYHIGEANGMVQAPVFKVGNLVTVNQDPYPALGQLFMQLWDGDDLIARVYADDERTLHKRVAALNTCTMRTKDLTDDEIGLCLGKTGQ